MNMKIKLNFSSHNKINYNKLIIKRNGHCLYSEYKTEGLPSKKDS